MTHALPKRSRPVLAFLITTSVVTLFIVAAWYVLFGPATGSPPKVRPASVPHDATWAGGADGGAYIRCAVNLARNVDHCEVWNEFTGDLVESGDYQVRTQARAATGLELRGLRGADFDGQIYLEHEVVLDRLPKE